jgi:hypothetical protein
MPAKRLKKIDLHPSIWRQDSKTMHGGSQQYDSTLELSPLKYQTGGKQEESGIQHPIARG